MKKIWKTIAIVLGALVGAVFVFALFLILTEFRPAETESVTVSRAAEKDIHTGEAITLLTWNIGYGALGDNADFFMDGGRGVKTADLTRLQENLAGIEQTIADIAPDILFIQEIDQKSTRSSSVDEVARFRDFFAKTDSAFANNFKVAFVPYPFPPIGRVDSGILTMSCFPLKEAQRISLPVSFSFPVSVVNLKRCLLVSRIDLPDTEAELVLVNLHLEAYDDGAGKEAQTAQLKELLEREVAAGNYVIAGGDFNQFFSGTDISAYPTYEGRWKASAIEEEAFGEDFRFLMDEKLPTCRSLDKPYAGADLTDFQYYVLDGFIVSANIRVEEFETLDTGFVYADHNPVLLRVTLLPS